MKVTIIGAGKLGIRIAEALLSGDYEIIMIDKNKEKTDIVSQHYDIFSYTGDARSLNVLKEAGVEGSDFVLCCTSSDDANIIIASLCRTLNCKKIVARTTEPEYMNQIDSVSQNFKIDALVNPDLLITAEIYRYLIEKYSLENGIYTNKRIAMIEYNAKITRSLLGLSVKEFRQIHTDIIIVGISRHGKLIIPHGDDIIENDDILYIVGEKDTIMKFFKHLVHSTKKLPSAHNVMIVGGGRTGYYLAKRLSESGTHVTLIESNAKRCDYLSSALNNVNISHGNGTDIEFLEDEGISRMDAVVTATGLDEENLLLALTAKNHGVEDVISKISHQTYDELISKLGIDMVLNPVDISAATIMRMISGDKRVLSTVLLQGQAELIEIYAEKNMYFVGIPLKDMDLPESVIIAAINRGSETIIPDGTTVIHAGDHVILVCLLSNIGYIEKMMRKVNRGILKEAHIKL